MPVVRPYLFIVSRVLFRRTNHICKKHFATTFIPPKINIADDGENFDKKSPTTLNDPDIFGTLSSPKTRVSLKLDSLVNQDSYLDDGDMLEEKYLSFQPSDRKSVQQFELDIEKLVKKRLLKDALHLMEVTMKEDKVKPTRSIYSLLIGACGRAGYTKKAFSLYNQV